MPVKSQVRDVTLTPALLRKLMPALRDNRNLRPRHIEKLARDMTAGRWTESNDALVFVGSPGSSDFACRNGQHRLSAYALALQTNPTLVIPITLRYNADPASAVNMDIGVPRSLPDTLDFIEGRDAGHKAMATVALLAWHVRRGSYLSRLPAPTRVQILDFIEQNRDDLNTATEYGKAMQSRLRGPLSGYAVAVWLMLSGKHPAQVEAFVNDVVSGENATMSDPAFRVREQLMTAAMQSGTDAPDRRRGWYYAALLVRAWNAYVNGDKAPRAGYRVSRQTGIPEPR